MSETADKEPRNIYQAYGFGAITWVDPLNARAADEQYARSTIGKDGTTVPLDAINFKITHNDIPDDSTIDGIQIGILRKADGAGMIADYALRLVRNNVIIGEDKASGVFWPTDLTLKTYGGATDLWTTTDLTLENIRQRDLGIRLEVYNDDDENRIAYVDVITLRIYYTPPAAVDDPTAINLSHHLDLP